MAPSGPALLVLKERYALRERTYVEIVIWKVPVPLAGSRHLFKYRLALVVDGVCVVRYDNEAGKGDHKHLRSREYPYEFQDIETLQVDFWSDVERRLET